MSEGLPSMQSTSNAGGHTEDDERYHNKLELAARPVISSKRATPVELPTASRTVIRNLLCES